MSSPLPKPVRTTRNHEVKVWAEELLSYTPKLRRIGVGGSMLDPIRKRLGDYRTRRELTKEEVCLAAAALEEAVHARAATFIASLFAAGIAALNYFVLDFKSDLAAPATVGAVLVFIYSAIALSKVSGIGLEAVIKHRVENETL